MNFDANLLNALRQAEHIVVSTGAGVSAESGIPTFRDAQTGIWAEFNPEDLATPEAFRRNPKMVWEWYAFRRDTIAECNPNPGHYAIVEMAQHAKKLTLITQNVDGLHEKAGSVGPIELHGNISKIKCFDHHHPIPLAALNNEVPPTCPECGSYARPDVVWFGEGLNPRNIDRAYAAAENCHVFISVGTSAIVYPAANLPQIALERGATFIEINPNDTPLTRWADYALQGPSGEVLPQLVAAAWPG